VWIKSHGGGGLEAEPPAVGGQLGLEAEPPEFGKFLQIFSKN